MIKRGQTLELSGNGIASETVVVEQIDASQGKLVGKRMLEERTQVHLSGEGFVIFSKIMSCSKQGEYCLSVIEVQQVMPVMSSLGKLVSAVQRTTPRTTISQGPSSFGLSEEVSEAVETRRRDSL